MKHNNYFEIIVGTFVLVAAGTFLFNSFQSAKVNNFSGHEIIAKFDDSSGVAAGSDVKISGIKIGVVKEMTIDNLTYRAVVKMAIDDSINIPSDSSAKITSSGLLGEKYLEISPGSDDLFLKSGDEILYTQSSVNFEQLLGKFIYNDDKKDKKNDTK